MIRLVLFVKKVPKIIQGTQTRSPFQQFIFCIHDAQTVCPLKTHFHISSRYRLQKMFFDKFSLTLVFHLLGRFLEIYPHDSLIANIGSRGFSILHMEEDDFLSSQSISHSCYLWYYGTILYTSFFSEFAYCSSLKGFSFFHSSLRQHIAPISMEHTEDFLFSFSLAYIYTTRTVIEPEIWGNFFLPDFECFLSFFGFHETIVVIFSPIGM